MHPHARGRVIDSGNMNIAVQQVFFLEQQQGRTTIRDFRPLPCRLNPEPGGQAFTGDQGQCGIVFHGRFMVSWTGMRDLS